MPVFKTKLIDRREIAKDTMAFFWEKPKGFEFKAGQYVDITLIDPPETDAEGNTRAFSIAAAPFEDFLMSATRMRDTAFKRTLRDAAFGLGIKMDGPMGNLTLHNNTSRPAVFLAGGIGITPFRSMIVDAAHHQLPHKIYLFYSNRTPESAAFLEELTLLTHDNPNYYFIPVMTDMENSHKQWGGELGRITNGLILRYLEDFQGPVYYIAGPPNLVTGMKKMLNESGVNDDDIKTEEFAGYP